jgi:hypothetical protein
MEIESAGQDRDRQLQAARAWVISRLDADTGLAQLKAAYVRHAMVVPAALALGRIKLQQARAATGKARVLLLAEAERLFLAVRAEAEGQPGFHLALGQVYHRLGRPAEGDAELAKLLQGPDEQRLEVASVYRDLGLGRKAIDLLENIYAHADQLNKYHAAHIRALLADQLIEREKWLKLADPKDEAIILLLKEAQAGHAQLDGRDAEAARLFGEIAARDERAANHNPVAANNAAVAYENRYQALGELKDLEHALRLLENAYRSESNVALIAENLSRVLTYLGTVRVLGRFVPVSLIRPSSRQAETLLGLLVEGPQRAAVLSAVHAEPLLLRAAEVERQAEVLSPQWVEIYDQEIDLADLTDDDNAIAELDARLQAQTSLDTETAAHQFERYVAGDYGAQFRQQLDAEVGRLAKIVTDAHQRHNARAEGFALVLSGGVSMRRAIETGNAQDLVASERAQRDALHLVPEIGPMPLAWALVTAATARAAAADSDFARFWSTAHRRYTADSLLLAIREGEGGAARLAALRRRPELGEATRLLREDAHHQPGVAGLVLARVAGDDALAARESRALSRASVQAVKRIRVRLHPEQPGNALLLEFVTAASK